MSVREAKAHFSSVLDQVINGEEVVVTSHGKPKVRIVPIEPAVPLEIDTHWLSSMRTAGRRHSAERIIRSERDERG